MNKEIIKGVKNAGSIFIGKFSLKLLEITLPVQIMFFLHQVQQDFHPVYLLTFFEASLCNKNNKTGIERLGSSVINLAKHENLDGHAYSVEMRLKKEINWLNKKL